MIQINKVPGKMVQIGFHTFQSINENFKFFLRMLETMDIGNSTAKFRKAFKYKSK